MTELWADLNITDFDGNTLLLGVDNNEYVYFPGFEIINFPTVDNFIDHISVIDGDMKAHTIVVGGKYTYFTSKHYKNIENVKIEEDTLLNNSNNNLDPFAHHLEKSGEDVFKQMKYTQIHTNYPNQEED